jgi:hypothetical protein
MRFGTMAVAAPRRAAVLPELAINVLRVIGDVLNVLAESN